MLFSIVIPVYNRPEELRELLESLSKQTVRDFEVIVVDDGSSLKCQDVVSDFSSSLDVKYYYKENTGPGPTRNFGAWNGSGTYIVFFDSDCIVPEGYIAELVRELSLAGDSADAPAVDLFGGPDKAHDSFNDIQKAINYPMTSIITTGGIRGGKKSADKFYPRTFNMGVSKEMFDRVGGFADMRIGEDVDFSYRVIEAGGICRLFPDAWVYHKRRSNFRKFFKQVSIFGIARIHISRRHPGSLKVIHLLPAVFTVGCVLLLSSSVFFPALLLLPAAFIALVFVDSSIKTHSLKVGCLSVVATFLQLTGYGYGFILGWWKVCILGDKQYALSR